MGPKKELAFKIAAPLLILLLGEFTLRHVFDVRTRLGIAERRTFAAYQGVPWADQYFKDLVDCASQSAAKHQRRYARYILQDINEDCRTSTVNYANRIRRTWNPDSATADGTHVYEIGMFGGSTMEGLGAIDDETIPSHLSKLANASPGATRYHVTNYGVSSYTFTQSLFKLITLLREGHHFDAVIFYGGANDVDYAYDAGEVGALDEEDVVTTKLEGSLWQQAGEFAKEQANACVLCLAGVILVRNTPILRDHLAPALVKLRDAVHFKKAQAGDDDVAPFADGIARYYAQSHALLAELAAAYHMQYLDFWQPSLMYENAYGPGEAPLAHVDPRLTDTKLRQLYRRSRDDADALHLDHYEDLSASFDGRPKAYYMDAVHVSGEANGIVAKSMFDAWNATLSPASLPASGLAGAGGR